MLAAVGPFGDRALALIIMDQPPERFFSDCYEMRSQLVHGAFPRPSRAEVDARAATLETFTGHLTWIGE
jgi:hypothetical protein